MPALGILMPFLVFSGENGHRYSRFCTIDLFRSVPPLPPPSLPFLLNSFFHPPTLAGLVFFGKGSRRVPSRYDGSSSSLLTRAPLIFSPPTYFFRAAIPAFTIALRHAQTSVTGLPSINVLRLYGVPHLLSRHCRAREELSSSAISLELRCFCAETPCLSFPSPGSKSF